MQYEIIEYSTTCHIEGVSNGRRNCGLLNDTLSHVRVRKFVEVYDSREHRHAHINASVIHVSTMKEILLSLRFHTHLGFD